MTLTRRRYDEAPLVEAVAEFRFVAESWDQTVPGLFFSKVSDTFPNKEQVSVIEAGVAQGPDGELQQTIAPVERVRLRRDDGAALISIGAHYLSISHLPPYAGWEKFGPLISDALGQYREIAAPSGLQRIGLRYVNHISFDTAGPIDLADYFDFYPHVGEHVPQSYSSFICGIQILFDGGRDLLKVQIADLPSEPDTSIFLLDIDYFLNSAGEVDLNESSAWLEAAHERVEQTFEGCINDRLRSKLRVQEGGS
jgi:uncharacterized protein (TIGR04255 family)